MVVQLKILLLYIFVTAGFDRTENPLPECRIMFYNVENLFDTSNDSATLDDDFTAAGPMHWTWKRYTDKLNKLAKVIIAAGEWNPPVLVGLCEIENRKVLNDLTGNSPLSRFNYKIVHYDSPDKRGIDVALLYDPLRVRIAKSSAIPVGKEELYTRDILYAKTIICRDTCHIFVNHWPSRSSGQIETDGSRMLAATVLKHAVDSVLKDNPHAKIVIMGDFNDEQQDDSLKKGLHVKVPSEPVLPDVLYNISSAPAKSPVKGTLKYQGTWNLFDQIIISGNLLNAAYKLRAVNDSYRILINDFLLEADETYHGVKPFRTYTGFKYRGGFSDHLPVVLTLEY